MRAEYGVSPVLGLITMSEATSFSRVCRMVSAFGRIEDKRSEIHEMRIMQVRYDFRILLVA